MNINYDDIITNANKRKDDLKRIESLINRSPDALEKARDVLAFVAELSAAYKNLDGEGRKLLPTKLHEYLEYSSSTVTAATTVISHRNSIGGSPITGLEPIAQYAHPGD